ncbi:SAM-dependent methyltransferase [Streptosporangium sp. NPDC004379]|uniref:SAM-dependent methyltransferase n=1 Tax=Streptosporangium sp. NPDC004379 TaxID=3366189 RepID=UPI0036BC7038
MSDPDRRPPPRLDTSTPNIARMLDYILGGKNNFAADRETADRILAIAPEIKTMVKETEAFLGRAVRHLVKEGIDQFLALGWGLPTQENVHQVARSVLPGVRVVYVSDDPVVLSHGRALLATDDTTAVVRGDILHQDELMADPELLALIDPDRPVAVLITNALQFIPNEDDPHKSVALLRDSLATGSHLVIAHAVFDDHPEVADPITDVYRRALNRDGERTARTRREVLRFFDGMELVDPGFVYARHWRPDNPLAAQRPTRTWTMAGVARKTG